MSSIPLQFIGAFSHQINTYCVEGNVLDNVNNASNPRSLILCNKNVYSAYFVSGTFLSTLQGLTHLILVTTLL